MGQELRFSQAIFIELEGAPVSGSELVDNYTLNVQSGKTIKITSASTGRVSLAGSNPGLPSSDLSPRVYINGKLIHFMGNESTEFMPIWLPEGQYQLELVGPYDNSQPLFKAFVSGVEFNLE